MSKGAGRASGLGDSDGLCRIARYPCRQPGIPPPRLRSAPPFDKGGSSRGLRPRKKAPLLGELAELARPEGSRRAFRHHPSTVTRRQLPEPFRPASRPPPLMGRLLPRASPAQKRPPCQRGLAALAAWGIPTGFAGLPVTPAYGRESLRLACARHLPLTREAPPAGFARAKGSSLCGELAEPARPEGL